MRCALGAFVLVAFVASARADTGQASEHVAAARGTLELAATSIESGDKDGALTALMRARDQIDLAINALRTRPEPAPEKEPTSSEWPWGIRADSFIQIYDKKRDRYNTGDRVHFELSYVDGETDDKDRARIRVRGIPGFTYVNITKESKGSADYPAPTIADADGVESTYLDAVKLERFAWGDRVRIQVDTRSTVDLPQLLLDEIKERRFNAKKPDAK